MLRTKIIRAVAMLCVLALGIVLAIERDNPRSRHAVLGDWFEKGYSLFFYEDGTVSYNGISGKWTPLDDNAARMDFTMGGVQYTWRFTLDPSSCNDTLSFGSGTMYLTKGTLHMGVHSISLVQVR